MLRASYLSLAAVCLAVVLVAQDASHAAVLPRFDVTRPAGAAEWHIAHDVAKLEQTSQGLKIVINGSDPYLHGPRADYPAGQLLWLRIRLKSDTGGIGQVFYYHEPAYATEQDSVRFPVRAGVWEDLRIPVPALGPNTRLRFDPPGEGGTCTFSSIAFEPRNIIPLPAWPRPTPPQLGSDPLTLRSGTLELLHSRSQFGGFALRVAGSLMAIGDTRNLIGYTRGGTPRWLDLQWRSKVRASFTGRSMVVTARAVDRDGAQWTIRQSFTPGRTPDAIDVETQVAVDRQRTVIYLPMLVLLPGAGSFGEAKRQAIFAGLEYLDGRKSEVSSSESDIIGPGSHREVPDDLRITTPLMAIAANHRYIGLTWERSLQFSALFDSPDRRFHAGGHLMGVLFPGSDGLNRMEGSLLPYEGVPLGTRTPVVLRATIIGGRAADALAGVREYVALHGLPPLPEPRMTLQSYIRLAANGWLRSKVRVGNRYKHAYWPGAQFAPNPCADAALYMRWLACKTTDAALASRLRASATAVIAEVRPADYSFAVVAHVRNPLGALVFGAVETNAARARAESREYLSRFEPDGTLLFHPSPGGLDYARTHFSREADGLAAPAIVVALEDACVCGDRDLIARSLRLLRCLDRFSGTVPRGAQTWEVPLHTPDILASAYLVRAYLRGFEITRDAHLLEQARYSAWTGVPFVYLTNPAGHPVGLYATTPVLGATQWVAPDWMGLPVQWCGLCYADALYRLARYDSGGPWRRLADGITVSGVQQTFPASAGADLAGLLPDSFNLRPQTRNGTAINPGTVQICAARLYGQGPIYDFAAFPGNGLYVHAPGEIRRTLDAKGTVRFTVRGWPSGAYHVLVSGLRHRPTVSIVTDGAGRPGKWTYRTVDGWLVLDLPGGVEAQVTVRGLSN